MVSHTRKKWRRDPPPPPQKAYIFVTTNRIKNLDEWMDGYLSTFYGQMETTVNPCTIVNLC